MPFKPPSSGFFCAVCGEPAVARLLDLTMIVPS